MSALNFAPAKRPVPPPILAGGAARKQSARDRVLARVAYPADSSCWEWAGHLHESGYGCLGKRWAHRASYEAFIGPIPAGLELDHLCRNRACVNPSHLEPVTKSENNRRAWAVRDRDHCRRGHDTTIEGRTAGGACRECQRERQRARRAARRLQ